ncbi:hypothetical protein GCM10023259_011080 [Thermocatellispora tengchongensis]
MPRVRDRNPHRSSISARVAARLESQSEIITMYDMYPWNRSEDDNDEAAEALQFALDRRDNGGSPAR